MKRTPGPWTYMPSTGNPDEDEDLPRVVGTDGAGNPAFVASAFCNEDAALIVEAVNSHAQLKAALLKYGNHHGDCDAERGMGGHGPCNCGWDAARSALGLGGGA